MGIDIRDPEQPVGTLSGGERQAVAIARAVYFGAKVLILDEPTSALGVKQSGVVLKYILQARERGIAVVFITHNPHHAHMVGDRFYLLNRGQMTNEFERRDRDPRGARQGDGRRRRARGPGPRARVGDHPLNPGPAGTRDSARGCRPTAPTTPRNQEPERDMETLKVGIIGAGWMGHVHARAYQRLPSTGPTSPCAPSSWRSPTRRPPPPRRSRGPTATCAVTPTWRELLADPDIQAVSVTAPNFLHREIGVAVAEAGKHLWIEKPVGLTAADAVAVRDAVHAHGVSAASASTTGTCRPSPGLAGHRVRRDRRPDARPGAAAHRLRRPPGQPAVVAVRRRPRRSRGARRPGLARRRPAPLRARRRGGVMARRRSTSRSGRSPTPRGTTPSSTWTEPGLAFGEVENEDYVVAHPPDGLRRAQRLRGEPGRRGGAEQLRVRGARHAGPGAVGLPPTGRAAGLVGRPVRRAADQHRLQRAGRRRVRRVPAGRRHRDGLRRHQGRRGQELRQGDLGRSRRARDPGRRRRRRRACSTRWWPRTRPGSGWAL